MSLKEYFDSRLEAIKENTDSVAAGLEKRLEGMNEFRDTLKDQAGRFITRDELVAETARVNSDLRALQISKATLEGKASQSAVNMAMIMSTLGVLIGLAGVIMMVTK